MLLIAPSIILFLLLQVVWLQPALAQYSMTLNGISWEPSCYERNPIRPTETKKEAVMRAWAGALELIDVAWTRFNTKTLPIIRNVALSTEQKIEINQTDPAYALFFAFESSENGQTSIGNMLENLHERANANRGTYGRPRGNTGLIEIGCSDEYAGFDICEGDTIAINISAESDFNIFLNFCPKFWSKPRFDELKHAAAADVYDLYKNPRYPGTDAKTIVHELCHFWWMPRLNLRVPEVYGIRRIAREAWKDYSDDCGQKPNNNIRGPRPDNPFIIENADTYAVYAEYGFFAAKNFDALWNTTTLGPYPVSYEPEGHQ